MKNEVNAQRRNQQNEGRRAFTSQGTVNHEINDDSDKSGYNHGEGDSENVLEVQKLDKTIPKISACSKNSAVGEMEKSCSRIDKRETERDKRVDTAGNDNVDYFLSIHLVSTRWMLYEISAQISDKIC